MKYSTVVVKCIGFGACALLSGCVSGLYQIETSAEDKDVNEAIPFYETESFLIDGGLSNSGVIYDESQMPVTVRWLTPRYRYSRSSMYDWLPFLSFGVFPFFSSEYMTQEVTITTPIGMQQGSIRVDAKKWSGWIPIFIGYPAFAYERNDSPSLPNTRIEDIAREQLKRQLIGQFDFKEYVAFAKAKNTERKIELERLAAERKKIDDCLARNEYDEAERIRAAAAGVWTGSIDADAEEWKRLMQLIVEKKAAYVRKCETERIDSTIKAIRDLIAERKYDEAEELRLNADVEHPGSVDGDRLKWEGVKKEIADAREEFRVESKKAELNRLYNEYKFEEVARQCGEEMHGSSDIFWGAMKSKCETAIVERDRKLELERIASRKAEISKLFGEKKYDEVLAECDKEKGHAPGAREEDMGIWDDFRREVELVRIEKRKSDISAMFDSGKYKDVQTECAAELARIRNNRSSTTGDARIWEDFRDRAKSEQDAIERAAEENRIEVKREKIKGLMSARKYSEVVRLCDEEKGQNPGSRSSDLEQWKAMKNKAIAMDVLFRSAETAKTRLCLKGFSLGMKSSEAVALLNYYMPEVSVVNRGYEVLLPAGNECICNGVTISYFNFPRKLVGKLFPYGSGSDASWVAEFESRHGVSFDQVRIRRHNSSGFASISVSQDCFVARNHRLGCKITYFGEMDVEDYNKDPEKILQEAKDELMGNLFSSGGLDSGTAYDMGMNAGISAHREANDVKKVRAWLKNEYEKKIGGPAGTLRIEKLND